MKIQKILKITKSEIKNTNAPSNNGCMPNSNNKKKYTSPKIDLVIVSMEEGIAAGSAKLYPGDPNNPYTPQVDDYENQGNKGDKFFDI